MADPSDDPLSLSHLSSQLVAHGYTSRALDLVSLFLTPPPSHSLKKADPGAYAAHVERIRAESTARDQVIKCLWNMLGARMDAVEGIETLRSREMVGAYELERAKGLLGRAEKERDKARKDAEGERAKAKAAQQDLALEQDRHRRARDELTKARTALQLVRTQAVHDIKRRETEALAATTRLQRLTSTVPTSSRLVVLNSSLGAPSPVPSSSVSVRRRNPSASTSAPEAPRDHSAEIALLEDALEVCDEERRRGEAEIRTLRECLGEVGEWCGGVIAGIKGFERESRDADEEGDLWQADESLLIPYPQFARPADAFAPTIHGALHHIRTRILDAVDATGAEVAAARAMLEDELEEERKARAAEEERRAEVERELESARLLVEQGEQLVSDFANERFLAGVGGGAAVADAPRQMYGDESIDKIVPGAQTISQQEDDDRRAAAAKLVKERARIESERAEKKRRRAVAAMLGELTFADDDADDAPPPPPKPKPTHSRTHSSTSPALPTLNEVPSPFLARVAPAPAQTAAPIPPAKAPTDALAQILAMADDTPVRTAPPRPAAIIAPRKVEPAPRKVEPQTKEVGKGKPRALHSTQTTERTRVVVTASFPVGGKRKAGEKENERRRL